MQVFRLDYALEDVERLYATGLFDYVDVLPRASALEGTQVCTMFCVALRSTKCQSESSSCTLGFLTTCTCCMTW